jgi:hypothetical protein
MQMNHKVVDYGGHTDARTALLGSTSVTGHAFNRFRVRVCTVCVRDNVCGVSRFESVCACQRTSLLEDACVVQPDVEKVAECQAYYNGVYTAGRIGGFQWLTDSLYSVTEYFSRNPTLSMQVVLLCCCAVVSTVADPDVVMIVVGQGRELRLEAGPDWDGLV